MQRAELKKVYFAAGSRDAGKLLDSMTVMAELKFNLSRIM